MSGAVHMDIPVNVTVIAITVPQRAVGALPRIAQEDPTCGTRR
ncbi:MAG TPA: hypothetical protein VGU61_11455 [Noviherbaspirillum sp.]|nr:hypothetical protein [Noviherbaspirillum sp.]